jgi:hypothetical protein
MDLCRVLCNEEKQITPCNSCKSVSTQYCSEQCRSKHWVQHKADCIALQLSSNTHIQEFIRNCYTNFEIGLEAAKKDPESRILVFHESMPYQLSKPDSLRLVLEKEMYNSLLNNSNKRNKTICMVLMKEDYTIHMEVLNNGGNVNSPRLQLRCKILK